MDKIRELNNAHLAKARKTDYPRLRLESLYAEREVQQAIIDRCSSERGGLDIALLNARRDPTRKKALLEEAAAWVEKVNNAKKKITTLDSELVTMIRRNKGFR